VLDDEASIIRQDLPRCPPGARAAPRPGPRCTAGLILCATSSDAFELSFLFLELHGNL
jgi:hypothetical protein